MNGKALYIRPTSLLMPVGYSTKKVLYLPEQKSAVHITGSQEYENDYHTKYRIRNSTSYLSHKSHEGADPNASFKPKKK